MPLFPPALWSRGLSPESPCESSGAKDEQTHSQWVNPAQIWTWRPCVCFTESHKCAPHLFNHVSDFPLLAFQHVIQMVDLFFENSHLLLQLLSPKKNPQRQLQHTSGLNLTLTDKVYIYFFWWCLCVFADLWSPFWPSSLSLRSSWSSSSRLRIASSRVALSCSIPPNNLWSSSMRLSFLPLASSVVLNFSSWSLRHSLSLLPSAWRGQGR